MKLGRDGRPCLAHPRIVSGGVRKHSGVRAGEFSCGRTGAPPALTPRSSNGTDGEPDADVIPDEWLDYEYEEEAQRGFNISAGSRLRRRSARRAGEPSPSPPPSYRSLFPTLPTVTAKEKNDQRIVGGYEAKAGDFPWQVRCAPPHPP